MGARRAAARVPARRVANRVARRTAKGRTARGALLRCCVALVLLLVLAPMLVILALRWVPPPLSAYMLQSPERPVSYEWVAWEQLPPAIRLAAVAAEDQRFPQHRGFDTIEIRAAFEELRDGGRVRGASTLSQQVARNLFLWPGGGLFRKGLEAGITLQLELLWPKRRILEVYLNIAEFGPGVYGVEAAARRFFAKPAAELTPREAALLAAVLPSPRRYDAAAPSPFVRERAAWIEGQMRNLGGDWLAGL